MSFSLNEVEATAKRAARGGGYSWGLAEEAGKATRWLCMQGLDGVAELALLLEKGLTTNESPNGSHDGQGPRCPLLAGSGLSDSANHMTRPSAEMLNVSQPALILPFAAMAARRMRAPLRITARTWTAETDGHNLNITGSPTDPVSDLHVEPCDTVASALPHHTRATPDPVHWETLNRFAHRTYAPATEESRRLGAGSGKTDND
ncbi:DUF3726 domain-containing protein [Ruegeria sp.]|uniref:DUF3726 domain-containing protein n=1 Tax=Ruegeria sp. TaxID=1879320 RepID=UPI003B5A9BDA